MMEKDRESESSHDCWALSLTERTCKWDPYFQMDDTKFLQLYIAEFDVNSRQDPKMGSLMEFCVNLEKEAINQQEDQWFTQPSLQTTSFLWMSSLRRWYRTSSSNGRWHQTEGTSTSVIRIRTLGDRRQWLQTLGSHIYLISPLVQSLDEVIEGKFISEWSQTEMNIRHASGSKNKVRN